MTDYAQEQDTEIEALQSIYPDELTLLDVDDDADDNIRRALIVIIRPSQLDAALEAEGEKVEELETKWRLEFGSTYPDEQLRVDLVDAKPASLIDVDGPDLMRLAQRVAEDGVGMPAAYSVIAAVQESLTEREDELRTLLRDVRMKKYRDEEEELRKKLEGTTVTVENFLAWKQAFDEEQALANGASAKAIAKDSVQRLTGKALFLQDGGAMMITSDELFFEGVSSLDIGDIPLDDDLELTEEDAALLAADLGTAP